MSPEFYATIGVGIGLASLAVSLAGVMFFLIVQTNRRLDRLETRMDRLDDRLTGWTTKLTVSRSMSLSWKGVSRGWNSASPSKNGCWTLRCTASRSGFLLRATTANQVKEIGL